MNIWCKDELEKWLLTYPKLPDSNGKRVVFIFHCEFSSKRGPAMYVRRTLPTHTQMCTCIVYCVRVCRSHHLRQRDRERNGINFPSLYYPELYLLHGGYKALYTAVEAKAVTAVSAALKGYTHSIS